MIDFRPKLTLLHLRKLGGIDYSTSAVIFCTSRTRVIRCDQTIPIDTKVRYSCTIMYFV